MSIIRIFLVFVFSIAGKCVLGCATYLYIVSKFEFFLLLQELANKVFSFPRGQELPALCPVMETKDKKRSSEDEEEKGLTDAEQLKQDTIKVCSSWKKGITFPVNSAVHAQLLYKRPFSKTYYNKRLLLLTLKRFVHLVRYTFHNIVGFLVSILWPLHCLGHKSVGP